MERNKLMDGIILINKEKDYTSNDVVQIVKHTLKEKTGHIGTLDPNATGVLPILVGKGTKISKYLINHDKVYEAVLQLGVKTETADGEGKIIEERDVEQEILQQENVEKILKTFLGKSKQIPPMYSAIKINGRKLYDYARNEQNIDIKPRSIEIYEINLIRINLCENQIIFSVKCSKGTYIRTLCENIAEKLNTIGYMKELKRIQVGDFNIKDGIKITELKKNKDNNAYLNEHIISIEKVVNIFKRVQIDENEIKRFLNGMKVERKTKDGIYRIYDSKNEFIGTGTIQNQLLKRDVII